MDSRSESHMNRAQTNFIFSALIGISLMFGLNVAAQVELASSLSGDWTGESICVGEIGSCHDEQVVYHISVDAADATKVKIGADKIVDGKPDFMGDILLKYDAAKNTLTGNLESPRGRGVWEFTVKGHKGSFIFQHSATMTAGQGDLTITVVPNSGTEELKGITGKLTIKIEGSKHFYDFEYTLP